MSSTMPESPIKPVSEAPKARPLDYSAGPSLRDRLERWLPSPEQFLGFLKTLLWVAPLTLLIWVYAEREQTVTVPAIPVSIDVKTVDHNRLVTLRRPPDKNIIIELSGPRAKVDKVRELLQPKADGAAITIYADPQIGVGGQELLTVSQINNLSVFKNNGLTVKSAQPPYLFVDIDLYEERDVAVKLPASVKNVLSEEARFDPQTVKLRAPAQLIKRAEAAGPLAVYAELAGRPELSKKVGKVELKNVSLSWEFRENVSIWPGVVDAYVEVKPVDEPLTIASVNVYKVTPKGFDDTYRVQYADKITDVKVTGPREAIEEIRSGKYPVKAMLEIETLDKPDVAQRRHLKFDLPPGVFLTKESFERSDWEFKIVER